MDNIIVFYIQVTIPQVYMNASTLKVLIVGTCIIYKSYYTQ